MKIYFTCLFILLIKIGSARSLPDSIQSQLEHYQTDSAKVEFLFELSAKYLQSNSELNFLILNKALELAESNNLDKEIGKTYIKLGINHLYQNQFEKTDSLYQLAKVIFQRANDSLSLAVMYSEIGVMHYNLYQDSLALENYIQSFKILEKLNNERFMAYITHNISNIYLDFGDTLQAVIYLRKSIKLKEKLSDPRIGSGYHNLGIILSNQAKSDSGKFYLRKAIAAKMKNQDLRGLSSSYNSMASIYYGEGKKDSVFQYHFRAIAIDIQLADSIALADDWSSLASTYAMFGQWNKCIEYANKSNQIAKKSMLKENNYKLLSEAYAKLGEFKQSNRFLHKYVSLRDSIRTQEKDKSIAEMTTKFETEIKENENLILRKENKIQNLELKQASQRFFLIFTLAVLLLAGIIFLLVYYRLKRKLLISEIDELRAKINSNLIQSGVQLDVPLDIFNSKVHNPLTDREYEILKLAITQKANSQIAEEAFVSVNTVKFHLKNIFNKLGVANKAEALELVSQRTK